MQLSGVQVRDFVGKHFPFLYILDLIFLAVCLVSPESLSATFKQTPGEEIAPAKIKHGIYVGGASWALGLSSMVPAAKTQFGNKSLKR